MEPVDESKPGVDNSTVDLKSGLEPWNGKEVTLLRYAKLYIKDILGMHEAGSGLNDSSFISIYFKFGYTQASVSLVWLFIWLH